MNAFLFAPENPRLLAMLRIGVGLVLGYDALRHWPAAIELYSDFGPALPMFSQPGWHGPLLSPTAAVLLASSLLFVLGCLTIGWNTRLSLGLACMLSAWLGLLDGATTFTKYSVLGLHLLVLLACSHCGAAWSVDAWLTGTSSRQSPLAPRWPRRLIQLLVCGVYLGAALTKIRSQTFAPGDLLVFSLLDDHWGGGRFGLWLSTLRYVPQLLSVGIILFEILFPFLVWMPRWRMPMLAVAWFFHVAMWCALHVGIFSPLMMVALLSFLEPRDLGRIHDWFAARGNRIGKWFVARRAPGLVSMPADSATVHDPRPRMALPSPGPSARFASRIAYLGVAATCLGAGYFLQRERDDYSAFGRRPVGALTPVPQNEVDVMLAGQLPAFEDYFHQVQLGSRFNGNQVFGSQKMFRRGETLYVLAQFLLPHPALRLEGLLITPDGVEAGRFSQRVEPAFHYAQNGFELPETLPAGTYRLILRANGHEVASKNFELE